MSDQNSPGPSNQNQANGNNEIDINGYENGASSIEMFKVVLFLSKIFLNYFPGNLRSE